jgi:hypothetical protein
VVNVEHRVAASLSSALEPDRVPSPVRTAPVLESAQAPERAPASPVPLVPVRVPAMVRPEPASEPAERPVLARVQASASARQSVALAPRPASQADSPALKAPGGRWALPALEQPVTLLVSVWNAPLAAQEESRAMVPQHPVAAQASRSP